MWDGWDGGDGGDGYAAREEGSPSCPVPYLSEVLDSTIRDHHTLFLPVAAGPCGRQVQSVQNPSRPPTEDACTVQYLLSGFRTTIISSFPDTSSPAGAPSLTSSSMGCTRSNRLNRRPPAAKPTIALMGPISGQPGP
jgi:hypothetical protein